MKTLHRILGYLKSIETNVCRLLLIGMCAVVVVQVFARYLFSYSFVWAEELVRYLMIWMVMIGAARVEALGEHIRIDFFPLLAGPRGRRLMEIFFRLCTLTFLVIIFIKGLKVAAFNRLFESSGLRISMMWPALAIPIGALLIILYTLKGLFDDLLQAFRPAETQVAEEPPRPQEQKRPAAGVRPPDTDRS